MILIASLAVSLFFLYLAGPTILEKVVLADFHFDIDHRLKYRPGVTNEDGVFPPTPASDYTDGDINIVFLGDSFTYGAGLDDLKDAFPFLVGEILQARYPQKRFNVVNFAWPSSSPVLQLRQLLQIGRKYKPDIIITCFDMTDFDNDIVYTDMLMEQGQDKRLPLNIFQALWLRFGQLFGVDDPGPWLKNQFCFSGSDQTQGMTPARCVSESKYAEYWFMAQPLSDSRPCFALTWQAITDSWRLAGQMGASYALFILPRYQQYNRRECPGDPKKHQVPESDDYLFEVFRYFEEKQADASFPIHSLLDDFQYSGEQPTVFEDDFHFNKTGHKIAAQAIARHLIAAGLLPN